MNIYSEAAKHLNNHGVIAFPTETVMGLGVVYDDLIAYNKLNVIKNRTPDKPYSLMLGNVKDIEKYAFIDQKIMKCINKYLPGSLTLLLKVKPNVPSWVTCNTDVIGIRVPSNKEALDLLNAINKPLLVPSANKSGEKPCITSLEVKKVFGNELDFIIEGSASSGTPTTIVSFVKEVKLIREGIISFDDIIKTIEED